jgi:hypothetical protein
MYRRVELNILYLPPCLILKWKNLKELQRQRSNLEP